MLIELYTFECAGRYKTFLNKSNRDKIDVRTLTLHFPD